MSLTLYVRKEDVPEGVTLITRNDKFFNDTITSLPDTKEVRKILRMIDKAEYKDGTHVTSTRYWDGADYDIWSLSTGCKTALNVLLSGDKFCFSSDEMGATAWTALIMHCNRGAVIISSEPYLASYGDKCDVSIDGVIYSDVGEMDWAARDYYEETIK